MHPPSARADHRQIVNFCDGCVALLGSEEGRETLRASYLAQAGEEWAKPLHAGLMCAALFQRTITLKLLLTLCCRSADPVLPLCRPYAAAMQRRLQYVLDSLAQRVQHFNLGTILVARQLTHARPAVNDRRLLSRLHCLHCLHCLRCLRCLQPPLSLLGGAAGGLEGPAAQSVALQRSMLEATGVEANFGVSRLNRVGQDFASDSEVPA